MESELTNISYDITENFDKILDNLLLEEKLSVLDIKFIKYLKYLKDVSKSYPKPSPLRIITRSTAANLAMSIEGDDVLFTEIDTLSRILYEDIKSNSSIFSLI